MGEGSDVCKGAGEGTKGCSTKEEDGEEESVERVSSLDSFNRCDLLRILGGTFVTADQRGYHQHPMEPCSCRTRSSTGTNTLPLVVVCYAFGLFVVRDTEDLRGFRACS